MVLNLQLFRAVFTSHQTFFPINLSVIPTKSTETFSFLVGVPFRSRYLGCFSGPK